MISLVHGEEKRNMGAQEVNEFDREAVDRFVEITETSRVMVN